MLKWFTILLRNIEFSCTEMCRVTASTQKYDLNPLGTWEIWSVRGFFSVLQASACQTSFLALISLPSSLIFPLPPSPKSWRCLSPPHNLKYINKLPIYRYFLYLYFFSKFLKQMGVFIITYSTSIQLSTHCSLVSDPQHTTEIALIGVKNSLRISKSSGCPWACVGTSLQYCPLLATFFFTFSPPKDLPLTPFCQRAWYLHHSLCC